jgi:Tol biopolymer transport system component
LSSSDNPDQAQQITTGHYAGFFGVAWTPDRRLVYGSRDFKLWIINQDGSEQKLLTGNEVNNWLPDVSPDGRYIVFQSWRGKSAENRIWRMDIDGNNTRPLTEGAWSDVPRVSPDGKWVVYQSETGGRFTLWKVPINGGEPTQLAKYFCLWPAISPDGKWISFFGADESEMSDQFYIIIIPFEGGEPTFRFPVSADIANWNDLRWTPDGKSLAYLTGESGARNIWIKDLNDSPAVQLTHLKNQQIFHFDWSKDGKYLAYAAGVMNDDVVLIRNFK